MRNQRLFLDSCVVIEMIKEPEVAQLVKEAEQSFSIFISAVSLLEVGFGPTDKVSIKQSLLVQDLYFNQNTLIVNSSTIDKKDSIDQKGGIGLYIPEEHEWYAARSNLIEWMDKEGATGSSARKQANDALIFSCAWNANAFLITDNTQDFTRFNRLMLKNTGGHLPIFSIEDMRLAQREEVIFPGNITDYP